MTCYEYIANEFLNAIGFNANVSYSLIPEIENVMFNPPATIVFWCDKTKTVVKAYGEDFDPEKGLAMAISKKAMGNIGHYFEDIKKWTKKDGDK